MSKQIGIYILVSVIAVLLLSLLLFPLGHDQAIFQVGGGLINMGKLPFRDFLDMKQPLIFYIYALGSWIAPWDLYSIRYVDVFYQLITLSIFYWYLRRIQFSSPTALLSLSIYLALYISGGYWNTSGAESFGTLPSLVIMIAATEWLSNTDRAINLKFIGSIAFIGLFTAILFFIKVTLAYSVVVVIIFMLYQGGGSISKRLVQSVMVIVLVCAFILQGIIILSLIGAWENLTLTFSWLQEYAAIASPTLVDTVKDLLYKQFPSSILVSLTPTIIFSLIYGIYTYKKSAPDQAMTRCFHFCMTALLVGVASVLWERKLFFYHYSRVFIFIAPIAGWGIDNFIKQWLLPYMKHRFLPTSMVTFFVCIVIGLFLFYSPLPRVLYQTLRFQTIDKGNIRSINAERGAEHYDLTAAHEVSTVLDSAIDSKDEVFFWGNTTEIYLYLRKYPITLCLANPQLSSPWTPIVWKKKVLEQLKDRQPRFIICEDHDARPLISGTSKSSYESLIAWQEMWVFIRRYYEKKYANNSFIVFERSSTRHELSNGKY